MLITCPSCQSTYDLPVDRIGGLGRKVRCAACRESWLVTPPSDERPSLEIDGAFSEDYAEASALEPAAQGEPGVEVVAPPLAEAHAKRAARLKTQKRRKPAKGKKAPLGRPKLRTMVAAALIIAAAPALIALRKPVVSAVPGTATLYRLVGLPVNLIGLELAGVKSTLAQEAGVPVLEVTGEITNIGHDARTVPPLTISLEGEHGQSLYAWSARATHGELGIGQTAPFRVRLSAPPPDARRVEVTFADERRKLSELH